MHPHSSAIARRPVLTTLFPCFFALAVWAPATAAAEPTSPVDRALTLAGAIERALAAHPAIPAAAQRSEAAQWRRRGAARRPNPSLGADHENFGGRIPEGQAETTFRIEQPFELGGDRGARTGAADATVQIRQAEREQIRRDIAAATADRFIDAWALQERAWSLSSAEAIASAAVAAANQRFKAGAAPEFEHVRAEAFLALREVERSRARNELEIARRRLAAMWNQLQVPEDSLALPHSPTSVAPDSALLLQRAADHPILRRAEAEALLESWRVREARAARVPDVALGAGVRRSSEPGGAGFLVGLSLPLPLWNPLGDAVAAAEAEHRAASFEAGAARTRLQQEVLAASERYRAALAALNDLRSRVQPSARRALDLVVSGYRSGRLTYIDIIDGERSLIEADLMVIDATAEFWRAQRALESLTGNGIPDDSPGGNER